MRREVPPVQVVQCTAEVPRSQLRNRVKDNRDRIQMPKRQYVWHTARTCANADTRVQAVLCPCAVLWEPFVGCFCLSTSLVPCNACVSLVDWDNGVTRTTPKPVEYGREGMSYVHSDDYLLDHLRPLSLCVRSGVLEALFLGSDGYDFAVWVIAPCGMLRTHRRFTICLNRRSFASWRTRLEKWGRDIQARVSVLNGMFIEI